MKPDTQKAIRTVQSLTERSVPSASLEIIHDQNEPEYITDILQLQPTSFQRKGEVLLEIGKRKIVADKTVWSFSSSSMVESHHLEHHLKWLISQLFGKTPSIKKLLEGGARLRICCFIEAMAKDVSCELDLDVIEKLAQWRVPLNFRVRYLNSEADY